MTSSSPNAHRQAPAIHRERRPGVDMTIVQTNGLREFHLTLRPLPGERPTMMLWRLDALLREHEAAMVKHDVFGSLAAHDEFMACLKRHCGEVNWPVTWVEGACAGGPIAGMHVFAVSGTEVESLCCDGRVIGRVFCDESAKHCLLGEVGPTDLDAPQTTQAFQLYENIEAALGQTEMVISDVVRTWLFLDDILSWYGPFNGVRTEIFMQRNLFDKWIPASTGVGGRNPGGAAIVAAAWAVQPLVARMTNDEEIRSSNDEQTPKSSSQPVSNAPAQPRSAIEHSPFVIQPLPSPLQCPAHSYGSCFSRALELAASGHRRVLVSGTASIAPDGRTAHLSDLPSQIDLTMRVVNAILASRNLNFSQITRATAYFKNAQDAPCFNAWCARNKFASPVLVTQCDICRDELLFEIEVDAMSAAGRGAAELSPPLTQEKESRKRKTSPSPLSI